MNNQYKCSLTPSDIANVAASDEYMNAALANMGGKQIYAVDNEALVKSCIRIAQCSA